MVEEAEMYKTADEEQRVRIEAKNRMEEQIYQLKNTNSSAENKVDADTKKKIDEIIKEYEDWHLDNPNATKDEFESKSKEMMDAVTSLNASAQAQAKGQGSEQAEGSSDTVNPTEADDIDDGPEIQEID
jgi:L1 cell adhesion molecule like protein